MALATKSVYTKYTSGVVDYISYYQTLHVVPSEVETYLQDEIKKPTSSRSLLVDCLDGRQLEYLDTRLRCRDA